MNMPDPKTGATTPQPGGQPPAGPEGPQAPPQQPPAPATSPLEAKLEGDGVPENFRGKTVADVLKSYKEAEAAMLKAQAETAQWVAHFQRSAAQPPQQPASPAQPQYNPYDDLDERTGKAVQTIVQMSLKDSLEKAVVPVMEGVSGMQKEFVRAVRPDFNDLEERAKQYYDTFPLETRFNPAYGWDFAYRLAYAEKMGKPPLIPSAPQPAPPTPGPSTGPGAPPPTPQYTEDQLKWMKIQGMTPEQYEKYSHPVDIVKERMEKKQ